MERIYPSWDKIEKLHNPLTTGEKTLARFLDDNLSSDWEIYVQPYLNFSNPDIVILNPHVGIMVYEVKDWAMETYQWENNANMKNIETAKHIRQVEHYKKKIIEQLIPDMAEKIDDESYLYGLVKTGIYQHKISGKDARNLFNNCDHPHIIGYDDLISSNLQKVVPDSNILIRDDMQKEWTNELRFWLKPPFHSMEQCEDIKLTKQQKKHALPKPGHRRLRGAAGSGKTLIIAYRAAKLASEGYKVLIITFNLTLWHYIRDMIARAPFKFEWSKITFCHFHGFCNDLLNELNVAKPHENYLLNIVPTVRGAISGKNIDKYKFDAILIDEGQDYQWDWYDLLSRFLEDRDELLLVCDKCQNIYDRDLNWIDAMENVKFRGRWGELNTVHRLPKNIGKLANEFSKKFKLEQTVEIKEYIQLNLFERHPIFQWKNILPIKWLSNVINAYETIKNSQMNFGEGHASDIVILLPTRKMGAKAIKAFKNKKIDVNHVFESDNNAKYHRHKKAFWRGDSRLKISTIHSFKGWESIHVIMLIPEYWNGDENLDALVYTAMTRTSKNLIVLNSNKRYWKFGKEINKKHK